MKILVHIHAWNDGDIIQQCISSVRRQTYRVEEILLLDNGSDYPLAEQRFDDSVTLVRHERNLGTSGAVKTGLKYALGRGYDWIWILDADSIPRPDALILLVDVLKTEQTRCSESIGILSSSHNLLKMGQTYHGRMLTAGGPRLPDASGIDTLIESDSTIWSGSLINLEAVKRVGSPRAGCKGFWEDLSLDYGDTEYSYRIRRAGYGILFHRKSVIDHPIGRARRVKFLGVALHTTNHSAQRRYLYFRNLVYFWLFIYPERRWPRMLVWFLYRSAMICAGILIMEEDKGRKLMACARGVWDGLRRRLDTRGPQS